MNFKELLATLTAMAVEERPEDMLDSLGGAYDNDMGVGDAKVGSLAAELEAATAEIARLKSHNYDLMNAGKSIDGDDDVDAENDEPEEEQTVEDAFEEID